jgi:hypothetical protein
MKKLLFWIVLLSSTAWAQTTTPNYGFNVPTYNTPNWNYLINSNFFQLDTLLHGIQVNETPIGTYTVATLPGGSNLNTIAGVTDAAGLSCTVGGGSTNILCRWNGSSWVPFGITGFVDFSSNQTIGGNKTFTGITAFTGPSNKVNNVLNVLSYSGADLGAQINSAETSSDCPTSGCRIRIPAASTCYTMSTSVALLSYVTVEGDPAGPVCVQWTGTGSTAAFTLDWGSSHHYGSGLRDFILIGECVTTACSGNTSIGVLLGASHGAEGAVLDNVQIGESGSGFAAALQIGNNLTFMVRLSQVSAFGNTLGFYQPSGFVNENIRWDGGCICQNATGQKLRGFGDFFINNVSFDDNTTLAQDISGSIIVNDSDDHFENSGLGTGNYITATGNVSLNLQGNYFVDDRTTGSTTSMISWSGAGLTGFGNIVNTSGITLAEWINPTAGNSLTLSGNSLLNNVTSEQSGSWVGLTLDCPVAPAPLQPSCLFRNLLISTNVGVSFTESTAPSGAAGTDVCYGDPFAHQIKCSYNNGSFFPLSQTIGSGTSTSNGTAIAAGNSQAQPAITITGATTNDTARCSLNAAPPASWQTGIQVLPAVVTANTVTPWLSNPTTGSITPVGTAIRCTVVR